MIRRTPIPRSPAPSRRTAVKKKRKTPRRTTVFRCRDYLAWLRLRTCVVTRIHGFPCSILMKPHLHWKAWIIDAAHGPPVGLRVKGPDDGAIPLTRYYHEEQTKIGWPAFEVKYGFSREKEAAAHFAVFQLEKGLA